MKRVLISLCISGALIVGYLIVSALVVISLSRDQNNLDRSTIELVDKPLRAPKYVYYYFFPPTAEEYSTNPKDIDLKRAGVAVGFFIANILLYSIPVYIALALLSAFRNRRSLTSSNLPPESPNSDSYVP